eukprot:5062544-Pyramimonas_sp.AAC.1
MKSLTPLSVLLGAPLRPFCVLLALSDLSLSEAWCGFKAIGIPLIGHKVKGALGAKAKAKQRGKANNDFVFACVSFF